MKIATPSYAALGDVGFAASCRRDEVPKLPELLRQITLRRSSDPAPTFSTLTLSGPLLTMSFMRVSQRSFR